MKNKEKFATEIIDIACSGSPIAIQNGKPVSCGKISCCDCDVIYKSSDSCQNARKEWAESEYEPSVDWSKVAVDTPIWVSENGTAWMPRYFAGCTKRGNVGAWEMGLTSLTADKNQILYWGYAKLAEDNDATD